MNILSLLAGLSTRIVMPSGTVRACACAQRKIQKPTLLDTRNARNTLISNLSSPRRFIMSRNGRCASVGSLMPFCTFATKFRQTCTCKNALTHNLAKLTRAKTSFFRCVSPKKRIEAKRKRRRHERRNIWRFSHCVKKSLLIELIVAPRSPDHTRGFTGVFGTQFKLGTVVTEISVCLACSYSTYAPSTVKAEMSPIAQTHEHVFLARAPFQKFQSFRERQGASEENLGDS